MVDVRVEGADVLVRGLERAPELLRAETAQVMTRSLLLIEGEARRRVKQDTRQLMNSITNSGPLVQGSLITGSVGPSVRYGFWVERGRRAHGKLPPLAAIAPWARRHGLSPFLVARSIARKGIRPAPFLLPAWERHRGAIFAAFHEIGVHLLRRVRTGETGSTV